MEGLVRVRLRVLDHDAAASGGASGERRAVADTSDCVARQAHRVANEVQERAAGDDRGEAVEAGYMRPQGRGELGGDLWSRSTRHLRYREARQGDVAVSGIAHLA